MTTTHTTARSRAKARADKAAKTAPAKEPKPAQAKPSLLSRTYLASLVQDPRSSRPLVPKDVIRMFDSTLHVVQYVNQAGAHIVPLAGVNREIKGQTVTFNTGGRTISAHSVVERVNPIAMGGHSPEYARYVRMVAAIDKGEGGDGMVDGPVAGAAPVAGVGFDAFDSADIPDPGSEAEARVLAGGRTVSAESLIASDRGEDSMAKSKGKKAKANGAAKRDKAPSKVRDCVCGCGTQTSGYFAPGHDARYHGWIKKLADGRIQRNGKDVKSGEQVIGASVLNKMGLVAKGEGFKANTPEFYVEQ